MKELIAAFRRDKCAATAQPIVDAINASPMVALSIPAKTLEAVFRHAGVFASAHRKVRS